MRVRALTRSRDDARGALIGGEPPAAAGPAAVRRARAAGARRLRAGARTRARRVRGLRAELRRVERDLREAVAAAAAHRGDQVSNAIAAAAYKARVEG